MDAPGEIHIEQREDGNNDAKDVFDNDVSIGVPVSARCRHQCDA